MIVPYFSGDGIALYHGDCRDVAPRLGAVGAVVTDPPYGIGVTRMRMGQVGAHDGRHWDDAAPDLDWIVALDVPSVVWGGQNFQLPAMYGWLVWDKQTGANNYDDCDLAWSNRGGAIRKFAHPWVGANAKERGDKGRWHRTQKPIALMEWCISLLRFTGSVLDPYAGSGTTLIAARNLGIPAIGIEIDERTCETAARRLSQGAIAL